MKKTTIALTALGSIALLLPSCNTFIGVGQDFKRLGEGMEHTGRGKTWNGQQRQSTNTYAPPATQYTPQ